jgi:outer membrane protein assembly factor BamE
VSKIPAYRMEIQQGNFVSQDMVSQLKLGMSKDQVRFVLGTPLITDSFHSNRWDYVFRRQRSGSKELEHYKLAVFFEDSKLTRIDSDLTPAATPEAAAAKLAAPAAPQEAQSTPAVATPVVASEKPAAVPIPADKQPNEK